MNKFRELKNKGKQRNKLEPIPEPKVLDEVEVSTLLDSLNEPPPAPPPVTEEIVSYVSGKTANSVAPVIKSEEREKLLVAYCIAYNEERKKFRKIELDVNPKTGYSAIRSIEDWSDDPMTGLHKLNRILSLKLLKREESF